MDIVNAEIITRSCYKRFPPYPQALRHSIVGAGGKVSEAVRRSVLETLLDIINNPAGDSADAASSTTRMAAAGTMTSVGKNPWSLEKTRGILCGIPITGSRGRSRGIKHEQFIIRKKEIQVGFQDQEGGVALEFKGNTQ